MLKRLAKEICLLLLSEVDRIFTLRKKKKNAPEGFSLEEDVFVLLLTGFGKSLAKCHGSPRDGDTHPVSPHAAIGSLELSSPG